MDTNSKQWVLENETEYRFELDPGTSLAIKVRSFDPYALKIEADSHVTRT